MGSLSCALVVHGQLLSLQRPKTNRLPKPADRVPLRVCQRFCLWTGYHLAPRVIPRRRGPCSQSPAESPICRPWKKGTTNNKKRKRKGERNSNLYCSFSITKLQRSLTSLGVTIIFTSADKQGRTGSSSSQFILSGFDVVWR